MQIKTIICDIEGTTTAIDFVHKTLFPYSAEKLESFVLAEQNNPKVQSCINGVIDYVKNTEGKTITQKDVVFYLKKWIAEDLKQKDLKSLQGLIWQQAYLTGAVKGHVYDDVKPAFTSWKANNIQIGIYSSGSVQAQKDLFKYSKEGDLTAYLSFYFDTEIGHKRETNSYVNIIKKISVNAENILFLSDIAEELNAAQVAGMQVMQLLRPGTISDARFKSCQNFSEIVVM